MVNWRERLNPAAAKRHEEVAPRVVAYLRETQAQLTLQVLPGELKDAPRLYAALRHPTTTASRCRC